MLELTDKNKEEQKTEAIKMENPDENADILYTRWYTGDRKLGCWYCGKNTGC